MVGVSIYTKVEDLRLSRERLLELLKPGDDVYVSVNHVSSSGMTRWISAYIARDSSIIDITWWAMQVVDRVQNRVHGLGFGDEGNHAGVEMGGVGMDMGFYLVYLLATALWPEGFECTGGRCPSNDHANGDRDYTPGHVVHRDGGYALNKRWL